MRVYCPNYQYTSTSHEPCKSCTELECWTEELTDDEIIENIIELDYTESDE